jgi:hypothetical protein
MADPRTEAGEPELSPIELAESALRKLVTVIVIAAGLIALAIYARPAPPRFQAFAVGGEIVRIDTRKGTIIACDGARCAIIVRQGQHLDHVLGHPLLPALAAAPAPAPAPAPAALPAPR